MDIKIGKIYLSDILNSPLEIYEDPNSKNFKFIPPAIFNINRRIIYLDKKNNVEKVFKLNALSKKLESISFKINIDDYKAPLPNIKENVINVLELNTAIISLPKNFGSNINVSCRLGEVKLVSNKIKYTAPKLNNIPNYASYPNDSKIGTDTIIVTASKAGSIDNKLKISVNILKFNLSKDDMLVDDDFYTFIVFTDNAEVV